MSVFLSDGLKRRFVKSARYIAKPPKSYCVAKHDPQIACIVRRKAAAERAVIECHSIYVLFVIWSEVDTMPARVMSGAELA
jgi:hypothetical protein